MLSVDVRRQEEVETPKRVRGKGYLFWIPKTKINGQSRLGMKELVSCRVNPDDVYQSSDYNYATTFFLECRNLHHSKPHDRGYMCAVWTDGTSFSRHPYLGIIRYMIPERNYVEMYVWVGDVHVTPTSALVIPSFICSTVILMSNS